jgi:hypothetical protein
VAEQAEDVGHHEGEREGLQDGGHDVVHRTTQNLMLEKRV